MNRWTRRDVTGPLRARNLLQPCARLIRHGHKDEALSKIAGAVACGFITPASVAKELKVSADELNAAVTSYRQNYKD